MLSETRIVEDCAKLRLKIQDYIATLSDEERILVTSITVSPSALDKLQRGRYDRILREQADMELKLQNEQAQRTVELNILTLGEYLGINIIRTQFAESVADFYARTGNITDKQKTALLKHNLVR